MKLAKITGILLLFLQVGYAQENNQEVGTTMLTLETLITHAADQFPADEPQQLYILVETDVEGISTDARFYIEQGMRLLLKRLAPTDLIAIGTYGYDNQTILDFTEVSDMKSIRAGMQQLYASETTENGQDGIDLAYQFAGDNYKEAFISKVLMLRNDNITSMKSITKNESSKKKNNRSNVQADIAPNTKLGGAIAITALSILPEILDIIKN